MLKVKVKLGKQTKQLWHSTEKFRLIYLSLAGNDTVVRVRVMG